MEAHVLWEAVPVAWGRVSNAMRHLRGWLLACVVLCGAQVLFKAIKALRGEVDTVDVVLLGIFMTGLLAAVAYAVKLEAVDQRD